MVVRFEDIITRVTGNVDRYNTDLEYYVGGDQYDSSALTIERRGNLKKDVDILGFKFHFPFKCGDVLLMARNPHLRKAGQVYFEGLCSDASYILRTKDENRLRQNYIPIILQSNHFWDWFESHKAGGITFLLNWGTLKTYEFELPDITVQDHMMNKIWAAYRLKQSYQRLITTTDEMVKSRFIARFINQSYDKKRLGDVSSVYSGKTIDLALENEGGPVAYLKVADLNLVENDRVVTTSSRFVSEQTAKTSGLVPIGATIFPKNGAAALHNKKRITSIITCVDMNTMAVYSTSENVKPEYLYSFLESQDLAALTLVGAIPQIRAKDVQALLIPMPTVEEQERYIAMMHQADKSKFELKKAIEKIDKVMRSLLR